ncbi:MAG: hypothetical protein IPO56_17130 [Flavobacteriales bacterium]|nr:hypothetical protein [Flavobacteriales bacterium]
MPRVAAAWTFSVSMSVGTKAIGFLIALCVLEACATVPITGRRQMNLVGEGEMMAMADTQYGQFLVENQPLPDGNADLRVAHHRQPPRAASHPLPQRQCGPPTGSPDSIGNSTWDDPTVNAVHARWQGGGHYTGIYPLRRVMPDWPW